jgi:hypothetical protein
MPRKETRAHIIVSPATMTELRLDAAMRRRALTVNATAYAMRHGADLLALSAPVLRPVERAALAEAVATLGAEQRWTDVTTRRLEAALAPARRRARLSGTDPDDETGLSWHLDRLQELIAQHEALRYREAVLAMATTERALSTTARTHARGRVRPHRRNPALPASTPAA